MTAVHVLGGWQSDFAEKALGGDIHPLLDTATQRALIDARVAAADIDVIHIGNFAAEVFCGQGQLGGIVAAADPNLAGTPASRHEAACASGSMALLAAMADIESGRYDIALVVGAEVLRNRAGQEAGMLLGCAAWAGREVVDDPFPWPSQFARIADEYDRRYGLDHAHLGRIAEINFDNARRNPRAQTRDWVMPSSAFYEDDEQNPQVVGHLRRYDCSRITDGSAAVVLASAAAARRWAAGRAIDVARVPRIIGWGHRTAPMLLEDKLAASADAEYVFPHLRQTILDAYRRAGITGPGELDLIETHDCFTISEYLALDHFGITPPGKAWQSIDDGMIEPDGALPVNPSGGLLGLGHPVGATGVRMVLDAARQVTGSAGDHQIEGATRVATLNIGGSVTTAAAFVVSTDAADRS
jgi:acetyl-CoA C-acetyltransferase